MNPYKRILLKLSGEVLKGKSKKHLFNEKAVLSITKEIAELAKNHQVVIFMGGGNIFRWRDNVFTFLDQITGDWIGIKSTILNGLVLLGALKNKYKCKVKMFTDHTVLSSPCHSGKSSLDASRIDSGQARMTERDCFVGLPPRNDDNNSSDILYEKYSITKAKKYLSNNNILIISSCGKPYQTTDTGAAERAKELKCNVILKGSKVNGVYSTDPKKDKNAKLYPELSYQQAIDEKLDIMDDKAFKICQDNKIPIIVFNLYKKGNIKKAVEGKTGSLIHN